MMRLLHYIQQISDFEGERERKKTQKKTALAVIGETSIVSVCGPIIGSHIRGIPFTVYRLFVLLGIHSLLLVVVVVSWESYLMYFH